jgi:hypothetical protein
MIAARRPIEARDLLLALAFACLGLPGAWPGSSGEPDPRALLVWLALIAVPTGCAVGGSRLRLWPLVPVVPALWCLEVGIIDALSERDLRDPALSALALAGLYFAGVAIGRTWPRGKWRTSAALFLVTALVSGLPLLGLHLRSPWPSELRARLLDFSPVTLVSECAGIDWMRQPVIYDAAGTVDIDPTMRSPFRGSLAGAIVFVVGSVLALAADVRARRMQAR